MEWSGHFNLPSAQHMAPVTMSHTSMEAAPGTWTQHRLRRRKPVSRQAPLTMAIIVRAPLKWNFFLFPENLGITSFASSQNFAFAFAFNTTSFLPFPIRSPGRRDGLLSSPCGCGVATPGLARESSSSRSIGAVTVPAAAEPPSWRRSWRVSSRLSVAETPHVLYALHITASESAVIRSCAVPKGYHDGAVLYASRPYRPSPHVVTLCVRFGSRSKAIAPSRRFFLCTATPRSTVPLLLLLLQRRPARAWTNYVFQEMSKYGYHRVWDFSENRDNDVCFLPKQAQHWIIKNQGFAIWNERTGARA
ncbi:hypothetical protein BC827DRAFT_1154924 [Russula dissimulans]|nr:hypothetical protein BC827DRAFT_1154924 [Russula dissimulans]